METQNVWRENPKIRAAPILQTSRCREHVTGKESYCFLHISFIFRKLNLVWKVTKTYHHPPKNTWSCYPNSRKPWCICCQRSPRSSRRTVWQTDLRVHRVDASAVQRLLLQKKSTILFEKVSQNGKQSLITHLTWDLAQLELLEDFALGLLKRNAFTRQDYFGPLNFQNM